MSDLSAVADTARKGARTVLRAQSAYGVLATVESIDEARRFGAYAVHEYRDGTLFRTVNLGGAA